MSEKLTWDHETGEEIFPKDYNPIAFVNRLKQLHWSKSVRTGAVNPTPGFISTEVVDPRTNVPYQLSSNQKLLDLEPDLWHEGNIPGYGYKIHNFGYIPSPLLALRTVGGSRNVAHSIFANYDQGYFFPGGRGMRYVMILPRQVRGIRPIKANQLFLEPEAEEEIVFKRLLERILPPVKELE